MSHTILMYQRVYACACYIHTCMLLTYTHIHAYTRRICVTQYCGISACPHLHLLRFKKFPLLGSFVCLSVCLSFRTSVCLCVLTSTFSVSGNFPYDICMSVCLSVCLSDCLSVCPCVYLSVHLSVCLSSSPAPPLFQEASYICIYMYIYACMHVCVRIYIYTYIHTHTRTHTYHTQTQVGYDGHIIRNLALQVDDGTVCDSDSYSAAYSTP